MPPDGTRQSNFEALRIFCMLLVVAQHLFTQGDVLRHIANPVPGPGFAAALAFGSAGRIAVNLFLVAGCWFLVDSPRFRAGRWLRIWALVFAWSVPLSLWMASIGRAGPGSVLKACLPLFGRPLWFASAWLTLLLLAPFLHGAFSFDSRRLARLVAVLAAVLVLPATVGDVRAGYFADLPWFVFVYLLVGFLKRHTSFGVRPGRCGTAVNLLAALAVYGALVVVRWAAAQPDPAVSARADTLALRFLEDIKSLPNIVCALCLFRFFAGLDLGRNRFVNVLARPAFAVYVAHQAPAFPAYLWYGFCRVDRWYRRPDAAWIALALVPAVYLAIAVLDLLRGRIAAVLATDRRWFAALADRFERIVSGPAEGEGRSA